MYCDLKPIMRRATPRVLCAALRDARGQRIGRFGLSESNGHRTHRWEWLNDTWPEQIFYMAPDIDEPSPSEALSHAYHIPATPVSLDVHVALRLEEERRRHYEVLRVDGPVRRIATLRVERDTLLWFEADVGGALELCPGWLAFRPCPRPWPLGERCWLQPPAQHVRADRWNRLSVPSAAQTVPRRHRQPFSAAWPM